MSHAQKVFISILLSFVIIGGGSLGYMIIEGWTFLDSLYMTVITLAAVGYGEVHPISPVGRVFTLVLIFSGVGFFIYVAGSIIQFLVEGRIRLVLGRRKLDTQINKLNNHFIICGYGRIGSVLARFLIEKYVDVVVIERSEKRMSKLDEDGVLYLIGEATDEKLLEKAGVHRAKGLVTAVGTDADNVFLVLIAKELNPDLFIVARASQNSTKKTLTAAGANKVISPYDLGARRMAHAILRPSVIKFLEMAFADESTDIVMEEITVRSNSAFVGQTLRESNIRQDYDLILIVIRKSDDTMLFNPKADTTIEAQDTLVVVGCAKSLKAFERVA